jgi:hypothetical protein
MSSTGQLDLVDTDDVTVLFPCTDGAGANQWGIVTDVRLLKVGRPVIQTDRFEPSSDDGVITTFDRAGPVEMTWQQVFVPPAAGTGFDALEDCIAAFQQTKRRGGTVRYTPAGSNRTRWYDFDPPDDLLTGFGEDDDDAYRFLGPHAFPGGLPVRILRQPRVRWAALDSSVIGALSNWSLWMQTAGRPDTWTWSSTVNLSGEGTNAAANDAYAFTLATTGSRILRSDYITGAAAGDIWTGQILRAWATDSLTARMRVIVEYYDGSNVLQQTDVGAWFNLGAQVNANPIGVTSTAAPGSTAKVRIGFEFQNNTSTAVGIRLAFAQLAKESTPSLIRMPTTVVSMDPAASGGRTLVAFAHGSQRTKAVVRVKVDAGKLQSIRIARLGNDGILGKNSLLDYVNGGKLLQLEAGSLGTGVSLVTDAGASPLSGSNNAVEIDFDSGGAGATAGMARRVRLNVNTLLASRRGTWDVIGRIRPTSFPFTGAAQLKWAPSAADPATFPVPEVLLDFSNVATGTTPGWVEKILGRMYPSPAATAPGSPGPAPIGSLTTELWARRDTGTGKLRADNFFLMPADDRSFQTMVRLGLASNESWLGPQLLLGSKITSYSGGSAPVDGSVGTGQQGPLMKLDALNEAAGTPPAGGVAFGAARHSINVFLTTFQSSLSGNKIGEIRIRNVTDSTDVANCTIDIKGSTHDKWWPRVISIAFDGVAGKAYQVQIWHTANNTEIIDVYTVGHTVSPYAAAGEYFRMDPLRYAAEHLDSSLQILETLVCDGKTPITLEPGINVLAALGADIQIAGYYEGESVLSRSPSLDLTYSPARFG